MADITVHDVQRRLGGDAQLVDVREDAEVAAGMIPGARHIPLGDLPYRFDELDTARPVIAICRSGNRSGRAAMFLEDAGFAVDNMQGGMLAWVEADLPMAR